MAIFAVTVTYGNRFHLLKQVIDGALYEGVEKVIVVDNNSVPESREKLKSYEKELDRKIKVLYLDDNYGSAGGFKRGLEVAYNDPECDFILLLDDDNIVAKGSLEKAIYAYKYLGSDTSNILVFVRLFKPRNVNAIYFGIPIYKKVNAFLGFHICTRMFKKINKKFIKKLYNIEKKFYIVKSQVAPYGGLFFSKNIISAVGYPNEDFFVYADDYEWTYRMTKVGINIHLCSECEVIDIDATWVKGKASNRYYNPQSNELKIYYHVRNNTFFDKEFVTNKLIFFINLSILISYHFILNFLRQPVISIKRLKLIIRAIKDGLNSKLGKIY